MKIRVDLYVIPRDERRVVIPFHYSSLQLKIGPQPNAFLHNHFKLPINLREALQAAPDSSMLKLTGSELIADGPGYFIITNEGLFSNAPAIEGKDSLTAYFRPAGSPVVAAATGILIEIPTESCLKAWAVGPRQSDLTLPFPIRQGEEAS